MRIITDIKYFIKRNRLISKYPQFKYRIDNFNKWEIGEDCLYKFDTFYNATFYIRPMDSYLDVYVENILLKKRSMLSSIGEFLRDNDTYDFSKIILNQLSKKHFEYKNPDDNDIPMTILKKRGLDEVFDILLIDHELLYIGEEFYVIEEELDLDIVVNKLSFGNDIFKGSKMNEPLNKIATYIKFSQRNQIDNLDIKVIRDRLYDIDTKLNLSTFNSESNKDEAITFIIYYSFKSIKELSDYLSEK